jgi:type I restriction enzyme R subunit
MTNYHGTETIFEQTTIDRLKLQGYQSVLGLELERPQEQVVFPETLRAFLARRYPDLPAAALDAAIKTITRPDGVDTLRRNLAFHQILVRGFELPVEFPDGRKEYRLIYPVDWEHPATNRFEVINQLPIHGQNDRRPDLLIYVNGLPLVIFELKNPYSDKPTVGDAYNQVQHYRYEIPQLFDYNAFVVLSDGVTTLHGMWTASQEWYAPWKSIDGFAVEPNTTGSMKTLVEGLFPKERLLDYLRDFILFEVVNDKITKKGARYHQFFAARLAAEKALDTYRRLSGNSRGAPGVDTQVDPYGWGRGTPEDPYGWGRGTPGEDRRIGVIWHTTGSGKSLSMTFLVGILRRVAELENPLFVIEVDRNDLDDQLHDQFVAARALVGDAPQARDVDHLRELLRTEGGGVVFTTIEKFRLKPGEPRHPLLSQRANIILIADEAHRSQYGFEEGFARCLADALPNAMRLGFTGTPVSLSGADTVEVFGDLIHTYDIRQSQQDKATVPIYYEPRQVKLHLAQRDIDSLLQQLAAEHDPAHVERWKGRWAALAAVARTQPRVGDLAQDLLAHFRARTATLKGKAMIVCMERESCVKLYEALRAVPGCPEVKIVMTGNLSEDPPEWSQKGYLTTKAQRDAIKQRMIDPEDPLQLVIVCDMWLTGTDIPCLHTLYVDKPMEGHNMIQAISRVNRVFRDKPSGLIVDYIGIGDALREAAGQYSKSGGAGDPAQEIATTAVLLFNEALAAIRGLLPKGKAYGGWRDLNAIEMEDLYSLVYGWLAAEDDRRDDFLQCELRLSSIFLLVKHLDGCRARVDEVIFYQRVRKQILKTVAGRRPERELDHAVQDLLDDQIETAGVVDIFESAGIAKPDISILDENFLQTFKDHPNENLRIKLLQRIVEDELHRRQHRNLAHVRSFKQLLERTLQEYHNRLIDASEVVRVMLDIKRDMESDARRAQVLGLNDEELAFYDAIAGNAISLYDQPTLSALVHEIVQAVKRNLKVDWTNRDDVKAAVRAAVKRTLQRRKIREEDLQPFLGSILVQAEALYANWPVMEDAEE